MGVGVGVVAVGAVVGRSPGRLAGLDRVGVAVPVAILVEVVHREHALVGFAVAVVVGVVAPLVGAGEDVGVVVVTIVAGAAPIEVGVQIALRRGGVGVAPAVFGGPGGVVAGGIARAAGEAGREEEEGGAPEHAHS